MDDKRRELERLKNKVTMLTSQPPEVRTVEKRVEVPVERVVVKRVEVPVEKAVDRPIDSPEHLARIKALEGEVAVIAGLFSQIAQLKTFSSQAGERRIEERVVVPVDHSEQLARIKALEGEVAVIAELRAQIAELRAVSSQAGEQVVEKRIEPPAEKIVVPNADVPVGRISEHTGDLDQAGAEEPSDEGQAIGESSDDLKQIRGVGPALERFLHKRGVFWFSQVATWSQADIDKFEFLLPNFGGRIQRENWVGKARVEYYKKYRKWLGDDQPPSTTPERQ
jgi:predicted flap endonuclease-1-like 5' DNA nuclease